MTYGTDRTLISVTIANGTSLSGEVNVNSKRIVGIIMPAAWTAANLSLQAAITGTTFGEVQDNGGTALAITAAAGVYIAIPDTVALRGLGRVKVRSGTSGTPVNQAAERTLQLVCVDG